MSFDYRLTALRIPAHPGGGVTAPVYIGKLADAGLLAYNWNSNRVISGQLGYSVVVTPTSDYTFILDTLSPVYVSYSGYCFFQGSSYALWYGPVSDNGSTTNEWILALNPLLGQVPLEYWQYTSGTSGPGNYQGSRFWTGSFPYINGNVTFNGRGSLRGSTLGAYNPSNAVNLGTRWAYWTPESGQLGKFDPQGTATGNKYFGLPQWKDQNGTIYLRSVLKASGEFTYGAVSYNVAAGSVWIIGMYGDEAGWLQSSTEPSKTTPVEFVPTYPEGVTPPDPPVLETLTLTFDKYVLGTNKTDIYMLKSGIWRQST
jgi:hypothetical protein